MFVSFCCCFYKRGTRLAMLHRIILKLEDANPFQTLSTVPNTQQVMWCYPSSFWVCVCKSVCARSDSGGLVPESSVIKKMPGKNFPLFHRWQLPFYSLFSKFDYFRLRVLVGSCRICRKGNESESLVSVPQDSKCWRSNGLQRDLS